jgi:hypothetical protein
LHIPAATKALDVVARLAFGAAIWQAPHHAIFRSWDRGYYDLLSTIAMGEVQLDSRMPGFL